MMNVLTVPGASPSARKSLVRSVWAVLLIGGMLACATAMAAPTSASSSSKSAPARSAKSASAKSSAKGAAAKADKDKSTASAAAAKDALPVIEKSLQLPAEEVAAPDARLLTGGALKAPQEVDAKSLPRYWTLVRRRGRGVRTVDLNPDSPWAKRRAAFWAARQAANGKAGAQDNDGGAVKAFQLPLVFNAMSKSTDGAAARPVSFEAVVMVLNDLRYQESTKRFEAQIAVGLRNPQSPADRTELGDPLSLLISANADEVTPSKLEINQLGEPLVVKIAAAAPLSPFYVTAGTIGDEGDKIEIPVERSQLTLQATPEEIAGWGLAKSLIQIEAPGLAQAAQHTITLSTTQGEIRPTPLTLDATGHGKAELRSDGTGEAIIMASGEPFKPAKATVKFTLPTNFLIATAVGALLGWIVRRHWSFSGLILAMASSGILTAAYAIGIRWMKWAPEAGAGEALTFFVAAMGAYLGVKALNLGGSSKSEGEAEA